MSEYRETAENAYECKPDSHISAPIMTGYIRNELSEAERERVDRQLASCESCLSLFMQQLEDQLTDQEEPCLLHAQQPDMSALEDRVIAALHREGQQQSVHSQRLVAERINTSSAMRRRRHLLQHPAAQYVIAASITLLLLGSGSFSALSQRLAAHDEKVARSEHELQPLEPFDSATEREWTSPSWSERMVEQTSSWLDGLQSLRYK